MRTIKEESLDKALEATCLQQRGLPPRYQSGKDPFWIKAIVLVMKRNMEECYCLYQQNEEGYMKLLCDFGTPSPILSVKSIHPYVYLDADQFIPKGSLEKKRAFYKDLLADNPDNIDVDAMNESELDRALLRNAITQQLLNDEANRQQNLRNEGSDLDGTNKDDIDRIRFEMELKAMKRDGSSKAEINAFKEEFEHRNDPNGDNLPYLSEEDRTRLEMEMQDEKKAAGPDVSVAGEFDAPQIDLDELRKATEEYRKEQLLVAKRKWKRAHDGESNIRAGFACENEFGEQEEIETIQLPDAKQKPEQKRKPGRPKKQAKSTSPRKRSTTSKKAITKPKSKKS